MKLKLWKMAVALITLASTLVITEGHDYCSLELHYVICQYDLTGGDFEVEIRQDFSDGNGSTSLLECQLNKSQAYCLKKDCVITYGNDTVSIKIPIKNYGGKIGCFRLPPISTRNSLDICTLKAKSTSPISVISSTSADISAFNTSPVSIINSTSADKPAINTSRVSIINSTSADKPGTCEQRILDYIHHIQQHFWAVAVAVPVAVAVILVILIKRTSNSTQSTSCCTGVHKNNNSEQTSTSLLNVELGEEPQNGTQVHTEECLKQPFLSHTPQNNGHTL